MDAKVDTIPRWGGLRADEVDGRRSSPPLPRPTRQDAEAAIRTLLAYIGEDGAREGLVDTPARVIRAYDELFGGYRHDPSEVLSRTFGETGGYDDFVVVRAIDFTSHCEHHMMPFTGCAHIAYRPVDRVVGLSKIPRLVEVYARRLQTQEHLTAQIASALEDYLKPQAVAVMIEAEHGCMSMRGVKKPHSRTLTTQFRGTLRNDATAQARVVAMLRG